MGEKGKQAVSKELLQIHMRDTFRPINSETLSKTEYDKVLESHLFLKHKRDHSIKVRIVAGGNKQRRHIDKIDATSPTAALESVLLTSTIDAKEGRDVDIIDIPNDFATTRIEDNNAEYNEDRNANLAYQGEGEHDEAINEVDDPPKNEHKVPTLADEAEVEGLPDVLAAQAVPETPE